MQLILELKWQTNGDKNSCAMPQSKMYIVWNLYMYMELNAEQWIPMMFSKICKQKKTWPAEQKKSWWVVKPGLFT